MNTAQIHARNMRVYKQLQNTSGFKLTRFKSVSTKKRVNHNQSKKIINKIKRVLYGITAAIIALGIYTKLSYDFIDSQVNASETLVSPVPPTPVPTPKPIYIAVKDDRVNKLKAFLTKQKSPLADHAALIVKEADDHDIGWTKIVAISAIESSYGKNLSGQYNAWNIMQFKNGKRVGARNFANWEEGIQEISRLLDDAYRTNEIKAVQVKYCPSYECNSKWVDIVKNTTDKILEVK